MTRIHPILFAVLLGLVAAAGFYLVVYVAGPNRLQQLAIPVVMITAIGWFMAQRVIKKPREEQLKQRIMAIGFTLLAFGGYLFADYKVFEGNFNRNCERSAPFQVCECIEGAIGPKLWSQQLPLRPQVALGKMSYGAMLSQINSGNRGMVESAARACSR